MTKIMTSQSLKWQFLVIQLENWNLQFGSHDQKIIKIPLAVIPMMILYLDLIRVLFMTRPIWEEPSWATQIMTWVGRFTTLQKNLDKLTNCRAQRLFPICEKRRLNRFAWPLLPKGWILCDFCRANLLKNSLLLALKSPVFSAYFRTKSSCS